MRFLYLVALGWRVSVNSGVAGDQRVHQGGEELLEHGQRYALGDACQGPTERSVAGLPAVRLTIGCHLGSPSSEEVGQFWPFRARTRRETEP